MDACGRLRLRPCAYCGARQSRGFGYCHQLRRGVHPFYWFCSRLCQDIGAELAMRNLGVIDKSETERQAIKDARRNLAETLTELGLMDPFFHRSPGDIDRIIESCIDGFRASMMQQNFFSKTTLDDDEIPF